MTLLLILFSLLFTTPLFSSPMPTMTIEEKVGQILQVHFNGETANDDAKILIQELHVGSIIYYNWANGLTSPSQIYDLSWGLQALAKESRLGIPLLIAADQEGGRVMRLREGFTQFPGNWVLGMTEDPSLAEKCAYAMGVEMKAVGVNYNLAPVVDINSNPSNSVIGTRSFGSTPEMVTAFAAQALKGYRRANVITSLKHFPGYGDVNVDAHQDLPVSNKTKDELKKIELYPYFQLLSQADSIMSAHILVKALDPDNCSTLSKTTLQGLLRKEMGYTGLIISDSLVMEGVLKNIPSIDEVAIRAIEAGCDMLCLGGKQLLTGLPTIELTIDDVKNIHHSIVQAVQSGRLSEKQITLSAQKIWDLKQAFGLFLEQPLDKAAALNLIRSPEHLQLAEEITKKAMKADFVSNPNLSAIAEKIWMNECSGKKEALTHWGKGEDFPSLGIGHFIWYPADVAKTFNETFPALIQFLQKNQVAVPQWIITSKGSPWKSREEFYREINSPQMNELRDFLFNTRQWQTLFMAERAEQALPRIIKVVPQEKQRDVTITFYRLANDPYGLYALIDYINFKGEGIDPKERYEGQGWGLLQVLLAIPPYAPNVANSFADAAEKILKERVKNAPVERNEARWLPGWLNRVSTYKIKS